MNYVRPGPQYPLTWNKQRHAIFRSMGYLCQLCGEYSKGNLHLHHIRPIGCGGTHHPQNMTPVCSRCHKFIHSGRYSGPLLELRNCR